MRPERKKRDDLGGADRADAARGRRIIARWRLFWTDETGATAFEYFMIAAFFGAASVVLVEAMGYSLFEAFGFDTARRN